MDDEVKYQKTVSLLKKSGQMTDIEQTGQHVMARLYAIGNRKSHAVVIYEFLFGWTEIPWVRRSLTFASFILILMFVYQQSVIVRQMNTLSNQVKSYQSDPVSVFQNEVISRYRLIKASGGRMYEQTGLTEEQIQMIIRSYDQIRKDYDNLMKAIESNPELKRILNEQKSELNSGKVKI